MRRFSPLVRLAIVGLIVASAVAFTAVAVGVVAAASERSREVELPRPTGPYAVGRTSFDWIDGSRDDPFGKPGEKRDLLVWAWYPAKVVADAPPASYMPSALVKFRESSGWGLAYQQPTTVRVHAVEDAPVAGTTGRFPVLLFMPGMGHSVLDYTAILEDLASRGYVVVGIDPTYSTDVAFPDGRVVPSKPEAREPSTQSALDDVARVWAQDERFAISQLADVDSTPGEVLAGRLDLGRIGLFGHSFGGAASLLECSDDTRCLGAADVDGTPYGGITAGGLDRPAMFLMSEDFGTSCPSCDQTRGDVDAVRLRDAAGSYLLVIDGARHGNYQDWAVTFAPAPRVLGVIGSIDGARGLKVAEDYLAAFFGHTLSGAEEPILNGPSPAYPEVSFPAG